MKEYYSYAPYYIYWKTCSEEYAINNFRICDGIKYHSYVTYALVIMNFTNILNMDEHNVGI